MPRMNFECMGGDNLNIVGRSRRPQRKMRRRSSQREGGEEDDFQFGRNNKKLPPDSLIDSIFYTIRISAYISARFFPGG